MFCGDDKECMGFVVMIKNVCVFGDDKRFYGIGIMIKNVWVLW